MHLADLSRRVQTVHFGHLDIHEDRVVLSAVAGNFFDGLQAVRHSSYFGAHHSENVLRDLGVEIVVLRNQHVHALQKIALFRHLRHCDLFRGIQRNGEIKFTALPHDAFYLQRAAHQFDDRAADGKPQARSLTLCITVARLFERQKNAFAVLLRDPHARILHGKGNETFFFRFYAHVHSSAHGRKFYRVGNKIGQYLPQPDTVARKHVVLYFVLYGQRDAAALRLRRHHAVHFVKHLRQRKRFVADGEHIVSDAAHIEYIVQKRYEIMRGGTDLEQIIANGFGNALLHGGQIRQTDDCVHGSSDLMAHAREKLAFRTVICV